MSDVQTGELTPVAPLADGITAPGSDVTATPTPGPSEGQQPAPKTFTQEELEAEVGKRVAREQRKHTRAEQERIARLESDVEELRKTPVVAKTEAPKREQFKTDEEYFWALNDYRIDAKISARREAERQEESRVRQREEQQKTLRSYQQRVTAAEVKYPDFHDVVGAPSLPITDAMAAAIQLHDLGPDVAYHLGKNPSEARRIADLPPMLAAAEIGALAVTLKAKAPPQPSKAPEPIEPVGGKNVTEKDPNRMSDEEFARWRQGHKKARR